jgi:hypothetical protein
VCGPLAVAGKESAGVCSVTSGCHHADSSRQAPGCVGSLARGNNWRFWALPWVPTLPWKQQLKINSRPLARGQFHTVVSLRLLAVFGMNHPLIFRVLTASAVLPSAMCLGHRSKRQASHCLLISSCCSWAAVGVPLEDRLVCFAPRLAPASPQLPAHSINRAASWHINSPRALHARRPSTLTHAIGASRRM